LPSPLKSPTLTSTQVAAVLHVAHRLLVKVLPVDCAIHHCPLSRARPTMSIFPSPLKSPTLTSTQVTPVLQVSHSLVVKPPEPFDSETHHWPVSLARPTMSLKPSPLKSPVWTSTQVTPVLHVNGWVLVKLEPLEVPSHHWPLLLTRPMMSTRGTAITTKSL